MNIDTQKLAEALVEASSALTSTLNRAEVIDRILAQIGNVVPHDTANVMLIDGDMARVYRGQGYAKFGTVSQLDDIVFEWAMVPGLLQIVEEKRPLIIPDISQYDQWVISLPAHEWIQSYIGVPMLVQDKVIGFLNVMSATADFFQESDAERLSALAVHAASAIHNAQLYQQAQKEISRRELAELVLLKYQTKLETLVKERTEALWQESFQRQQLELENAVQEERRRIGNEVHDGILQSLLGLRLRLLYMMSIEPELSESVKTEIDELVEVILHLAGEMRQLIKGLHTEELSAGLPTALREVMLQVRKIYPVHIESDLSYEAGLLTAEQEHHILRLAQEALMNACVHGQPKTVWLSMGDGEGNGRFSISIKDNGIGFTVNASSRVGLGIRSMRWRARMAGGRMRLKSEIGKGTRVRVVIA